MESSVRKLLRETRRWIRRRWSALPNYVRHFLAALLITVAFDLCLESLVGSRLHHTIETSLLDWVLRMQEGLSPLSDRPVVPFTLIDIDESTYQLWGEPPLVPRQKLVAVLGRVMRARAWLAVVDVDLSRPTSAENDLALLSFLQANADHYSAAATKEAPPRTQIVVLRAFRRQPDAPGVLHPKPSIVDDLLASQPRNIHQASPLFEVDDDLAIRRWRLWQPTCGSPYGDVLPSIQLLSVLMHRLQIPAQPSGDLRSALQGLSTAVCGARISDSPTIRSSSALLDELRLDLDPTHISRRISFRFTWRQVRDRHLHVIRLLDGRFVPLLIYVTARELSDSEDQYDDNAFQGRVVVIGGSYSEGRDVYNTPLGPMPGALVIVNAIHSLLHYGPLQVPARWLAWTIYLSTLIIPNLVLSGLGESPRHAYIIHAGLALVLISFSLWLLKSGLWFDAALPLVSVFLAYSFLQLFTRAARP